jgi:hypothetical protein
MNLGNIPSREEGGPDLRALYQPIPEVAEVVRLVGMPMYRRQHEFTAEVVADPQLGLPVKAVVQFAVPWDLEAGRYHPEAPYPPGFRRALLAALPDDFFPMWGPV